MVYLDRQDAGRQLARALQRFRGQDVVVLALPRGGVVVGAEVARSLGAPLGLILVRKIGHPYDPEYAIGAIAEDGPPLYDETAGATDEWWRRQAEAAARETINKRREYYYGGFTAPDVTGRTAILVDDGIATGLTMRAAVQAARQRHARQIIVAVPVAPPDCVAALRESADGVIVLGDPDQFLDAVGAHYRSFEQVEDREVKELLWEVNDEADHITRSAGDQAAARSR